MKQNPLDDPVRERMQPGVLSRDGFLGADNRPIAEIVAEDTAIVREAGLTLAQVADLLDEIHEAVEATMGAPRTLFDGRIRVREDEAMGGIPCPFGCGHTSHKAVFVVEAGATTLTFTALHAHMIRDHGFFEGRGSAMRLQPRDLVKLYRLCRGGPQS